MPFLVVPLVLIAVVVLVIVLIPISLVQRYRVGTRRQPVRGWLATMNVAAFALSTTLFLVGAAVTSYWMPRALPFALAGVAAGALLGLVGLALTRWETGPRSLHYTPNRVLVLAIVATVTARLLYGVWRAWHAWGAADDGGSWLEASGAAGALGAGGVVLGYYLAYWWGVRRRFRRELLSRATPGFDRPAVTIHPPKTRA
jgi:hypothetical protein